MADLPIQLHERRRVRQRIRSRTRHPLKAVWATNTHEWTRISKLLKVLFYSCPFVFIRGPKRFLPFIRGSNQSSAPPSRPLSSPSLPGKRWRRSPRSGRAADVQIVCPFFHESQIAGPSQIVQHETQSFQFRGRETRIIDIENLPRGVRQTFPLWPREIFGLDQRGDRQRLEILAEASSRRRAGVFRTRCKSGRRAPKVTPARKSTLAGVSGKMRSEYPK